jgi:penicillin-binding protein 2
VNRSYVIGGLIIFTGIIFLARLFYLQVIDDTYLHKASEKGERVIYPARGQIYDRFGKLIVINQPIYDVLLLQNDLGEIDVKRFCDLLGIDDSVYHNRMKLLRENKHGYYSPLRPEVFIKQVPPERLGAFSENLFAFPGFSTQTKTIRSYPSKSAAHVLGDIGEVSAEERKATHNFYNLGEYIGKSGMERFYEVQLRGSKGRDAYLRDRHGRDIGEFADGRFDTAAISGYNMTSTLDIELQAYGEKLMQNKRGSIVAIEPTTGEILAWVSSPTYDPNLLVGRERAANYQTLLDDSINKSLINRPLSARYPPGSTFKPIMGLIAWQEGAIDFNTGYSCPGAYILGGLSVGCHGHAAIPDLSTGVQYSCNAYFCNSLRRLLELPKYKDESAALAVWNDYLYKFGLGKPVGVDLPGEYGGNVPTPEFYDKIYKGWRWRASTIISLGIGQGELLVTPLQLANAYAILANKGYYITPHLARTFSNEDTTFASSYSRHETGIPRMKFEAITQGLADAVAAGTARLAIIDSITVCGKTGTAENPHGDDHSIFAAFAPRENPQIAIAVIVENATWGGSFAAPIASLMIEYYINREISDKRKYLEERMMNAVFVEQPVEVEELVR